MAFGGLTKLIFNFLNFLYILIPKVTCSCLLIVLLFNLSFHNAN